MITRRQLVAALTRRNISDWTVIERAQQLVVHDDAWATRREEARTLWTILVHHDVPHGRGSARLDLGSLDGSASDVVGQALSIAEAAIGPAWQSTPPAAPAKVKVLDPLLDQARLADVAGELAAATHRPEGASASLAFELMRERVAVQARSGLRTAWTATRLRAEGLLTAGERSLAIARDARRSADLELDAALSAAAADLALLGSATPAAPGPVSVILGPEVLLHGGGAGLWRVFADHADAEVARRGLTRYRLGAPLAPGADQLAEPLTITSDGALDWGTASAPVGDEGDAVRRFALIERGIATGLGMTMREAARRRTDPNGGVRNLVVTPGTWTPADPPSGRRTLEVRRLRSLVIDPYTGAATLDLALSIDRATQRPVVGGMLRLDLIATLARARRSAATLRRGAYLGPAAVVIEAAELLG